MNTIRTIEYPFTREKIADLRVGDRISLTGRIFTGRDRLHQFLFEGGKCPADLKDGALYHCGPVMIRDTNSWRAVAAGPTTSIRQEPYMGRLIQNCQLRVIIGKGGMGEATQKACAQFGCVYLHAVGGAASVLAQKVERVGSVHFLREFGSAEALWELFVRDMEAVVTIDSVGHNLHRRVKNASTRALNAVLAAARA